MNEPQPRKIIHVDMDAFYASVEQRDDPALKGKPVAVGGGHRGVVAAASYEARKFGVRSAMPSVTAKRRCPELIFVKPRFDVYRAVSQQIRAIFADYTDLIEPLSLDEAYLDVTEDRRGLGTRAGDRRGNPRAGSATRPGSPPRPGSATASSSPSSPATRTSPTACASSRPHKGAAFVATLPVKRFHGVGPVTAAKMERLGILTGADLAAWPIEQLEAHFGSSGRWYWRIARGIDEREVKPDRPYKSVSAERTFDVDYSRARGFAPRSDARRGLCLAADRARRGQGRTVTLKVKFADFTLITRSKSFTAPVPDEAAFEAAGQALLDALLPVPKGIRLLGLGLHSMVEDDESGPKQLGLAI